MTERSRFWDGTTIGDAATVSPYDAGTEFAEVLHAMVGLTSGVFPLSGAGLAVTGGSGVVTVGTGHAMVYGSWYYNDATITLPISTPASATRTDLIVLRKSWSAQTVRAVVVTGVEGGGAPSATRVVGTTYEVILATVSVTTGGVITVTDYRLMIPYAGNSGLLDGFPRSYYRDADTLDGQHGSYYQPVGTPIANATNADKLDGFEGTYYRDGLSVIDCNTPQALPAAPTHTPISWLGWGTDVTPAPPLGRTLGTMMVFVSFCVHGEGAGDDGQKFMAEICLPDSGGYVAYGTPIATLKDGITQQVFFAWWSNGEKFQIRIWKDGGTGTSHVEAKGTQLIYRAIWNS